jgi:isopenicillin-N N-acyltransferase like protein
MQVPVIRTGGSHYEVGHQIGTAARTPLQAMHAETRQRYSARWQSLLEQSRGFLDPTEKRLPRVVEELRGCAQGAGISFDDLFLMSVEELLYEEVRGDSLPSREGDGSRKGCSDLVAAPPATADGNVWLAHNNDLSRAAEEHLFVTHLSATGEPEIVAVTVGGIFISVGFNRAGLSLTGNQLYANDSRVGVPRLLVVRDILAQDNFDAALQAALVPERASSYNNLIASRDSRIVNVEGSATDYSLLWASSGTTVHTNHYLSPKMKRFEQTNYKTAPSEARCARASYLAGKYYGRIGYEVCEMFLRDHVFAPWSVCKHAGDGVTVFSAIINLSEQKLWLARGNPCQNEYAQYA